MVCISHTYNVRACVCMYLCLFVCVRGKVMYERVCHWSALGRFGVVTVMVVNVTDWRNMTSYFEIKLTDVSEEPDVCIVMVCTELHPKDGGTFLLNVDEWRSYHTLLHSNRE